MQHCRPTDWGRGCGSVAPRHRAPDHRDHVHRHPQHRRLHPPPHHQEAVGDPARVSAPPAPTGDTARARGRNLNPDPGTGTYNGNLQL